MCGALTLGLSERRALQTEETRVRRLPRPHRTLSVLLAYKSVTYVGPTSVCATGPARADSPSKGSLEAFV